MDIAPFGLLIVLVIYGGIIGGIGYGIYRLVRYAVRRELQARNTEATHHDPR